MEEIVCKKRGGAETERERVRGEMRPAETGYTPERKRERKRRGERLKLTLECNKEKECNYKKIDIE